MADHPEDDQEVFQHLIETLERVKQRREEELRKMAAEPSTFLALQNLADAFLGDLLYLCNFTSVTDGHGHQHEVMDVMTRLQQDVARTFQRLTGKPYVPEFCRLANAAQAEKEVVWYCQSCGHAGEEEDFVPSDGLSEDIRVCPQCSSLNVFEKDLPEPLE